MFSWYVPNTNIRVGRDPENTSQTKPVVLQKHMFPGMPVSLKTSKSLLITGQRTMMTYYGKRRPCFVILSMIQIYRMKLFEAVAANLTILKSPTVMRQEMGDYGAGKAVMITAVAVTDLAPMFGIMLRQFHISFRLWNESEGNRIYGRVRTKQAIRHFAADYRSVRRPMISMPPQMGNWVES